MIEPSILNVANGLTVGRILATPPLVLLVLATPEGSLVAALLFGMLALTDALDGYIARSRQLITTLGKLLDPFADKLLVGGAMLALAATNRLPLWAALIIIAREVLVSALRHVAYRSGVVVAAGQLGKAKMALQVTMVLGLLAFGHDGAMWSDALVLATVLMTLASGLSYLGAIPRVRALQAEAALR